MWLVSNPGLKMLSVAIAIFLWAAARGTADTERGYDLPVVLRSVPESMVVTDLGADVVNVRVRGKQASLSNLDPSALEYAIEVGGVQPGEADFEVDLAPLESKLPRGARFVSRSPAIIRVTFEQRATRSVKVRADVGGEPAPGFLVSRVVVEPASVRITGARSEVLRLSEVVTETVDVTGAAETVEREVRVSTGVGHVWAEAQKPVRVRVVVVAEPPPPEAPEESAAS